VIQTLRRPGRPGSGPVDAIETVAGEMRARGLTVNLEIAGGAHGTPETGLVPDSVVEVQVIGTRATPARTWCGQPWPRWTRVDLYYRAVEDGHLPSPP
jgi:hypothetical protein